jgi:mannose-6-phosphate isomerase-like protein (cupin superfamily)
MSERSLFPVARRHQDPDDQAPDGSKIWLLIGDRHGATKAGLCEVSLGAGEVSRPVWHKTVEEIWYVLEGSGQVWRCPPDADPRGVAAVAVKAGDAVTIPTGWYFQFAAAAHEGLRFLDYTAPPWPGASEAQPAPFGGLGLPVLSD